mgnify:CR=1 FL=1
MRGYCESVSPDQLVTVEKAIGDAIKKTGLESKGVSIIKANIKMLFYDEINYH